MMRLVIIAFLVFMYSFFYSQNVGFRGKKFSVEFNTNSIVSISNSIVYNSYNFGDFNDYPPTSEITKFRKKFKGLKLKLHSELTLNYSVARRLEIGAKIGYDRLNFFPLGGLNITTDEFLLTTDFEQVDFGQYDKDKMYVKSLFHSDLEITKVNVFETLIYIRVFGKNQIAPVGFFHQIGVGTSFFSIKNNEVNGFIGLLDREGYRDNLNSLDFTLETRAESVYYFSYALGNKKVYANGMYFHYGIELNVYLGGKYNQSKMSKENDYTKESYEYNYKNAKRISKTIAIDHFMQNKLGIGYIF